MGSTGPEVFSAPPFTKAFAGCLFDMDGTIIESTPAIEKYWQSVGKEIGVDPAVILATSHGRRSIDVLKILDPSKANWDFVKSVEGAVPLKWGDLAVEVPGARNLVTSLTEAGVKWTIVTSGTTPLVTGWLKVMGLPQPEHMVTAEMVDNGKPEPACYLMGRRNLGLTAEDMSPEEAAHDILVLEDAPAGVRAGKAAGCKVLAVATSHRIDQLREAGADWIVKDLSSVKFVGNGAHGVDLEIRDYLLGDASTSQESCS